MNNKGLRHLAQNKSTQNKIKQKTALTAKASIVKAVFLWEFSRKSLKFHFYVCFLAALLPSGIPLYADESQITTSASELSSLFLFLSIT